jgi:Family of unknown function (DUF6464)
MGKAACQSKQDVQQPRQRGEQKVLKTLLVIAIGFLPSVFSLWVIRKSQLRTRTRLRQAATNFSRMRIQQNIRPVEGDRYYLEGVGYLIGDISCKFNARSGYLRCAINPNGPCQDCRYYESRELRSRE